MARFARLAADNLDISEPILALDRDAGAGQADDREGQRTPLDTFAVAVAVTISLMFVTLLLAAGMLALEREEHAFGRLVRGLVSRTGLLVEKIVLEHDVQHVVTLLMLVGLALFVGLDWGRAPLWLAALAFGAAAFAALGRRDRRARARGAGGVAAGASCSRCPSRSSRWSRPAACPPGCTTS